MSKSSVVYECTNCGSQFPKWSGQCADCGKWNSLVEEVKTARKSNQNGVQRVGNLQKLSEIDAKQVIRLQTGIGELDRVLGGGIVPGEIILMVGEPGIGKSTLLTRLSLTKSIASPGKKVVYVCGEESPGQVKLRVRRLAMEKAKELDSNQLELLPETDIDVVLSTIEKEPLSLLIVDSVQTLYTEGLAGQAGGVAQIKECTSRLIRYAKTSGVPVVLVGHVTKDGEMAGPKILEHMVDVVLDMSGDRYHDLRLLRTVKNRFGATDEVGVFRMRETGLQEVVNPSEVFLEEREEGESGSCIAVVMEGTRPVLVEVQALVVESELPVPRRVAQGVDVRRVQILLGILQKHARLNLGTRDVFVKVTGGLTVREPAIDLAIGLAVASSYKGKAIPTQTVAIGELGLLGEVRTVSWYEKRVKEAQKLGYKTIFSRGTSRKIADLVKKI